MIIDSPNFFSTPEIVTTVLAMTFTASFLANVFQYILHKKDMSINKDKLESELIKERGSASLNFIENEIRKTKLKVREIEKDQSSRTKIKMLNFRLAYLNIEKKTSGNTSINYYWDCLIDNLTKLLMLFVPKSNQNNPIEDIEARVSQLKNRIGFLYGNKNSASYVNSIDLLDSFLNKYKDAVSERHSIDDHLKQMESTVEGFERPEIQHFIHQSNIADTYVTDSQATLEKLYLTLEQQSTTIVSLKNEIQRIKKLNPDDINANLKLRHKKITSDLEKSTTENNSLLLIIDDLKKRIVAFNMEKKNVDDKVKNGLLNNTISNAQINSYSDAIKSFTDDMSEHAKKEVNRLKDLLNRQRNSISKLDGALDGLRETLTVTKQNLASKEAIIDELTSSSVESELCVHTLERTIEELKSRSQDTESDASTEEALGRLNKELQKVKSELDRITSTNEINEDVVAYLFEALDANSLEDLIGMYFQYMADLDADPSIELSFGEKLISISFDGKMNKKDKILVEHMGINETNIGIDERSIRFRTKYLMGVIRSKNNVEKFKENQRRIIGISKVTDKLIEKIGATQHQLSQKKSIEIYKNNIKKLAYEIDRCIEFNIAKHKSIVALSLGKANELIKNSNSNNVVSIREEALMELDNDSDLRVKTRKAFLKIIKKFDDL